ncbi:MAG: thiamine pyrophosphate-binding protein [Actinobacteria bacterium]|nr:thiamine pyrophosphate-binding protein [Actinomycetota bacterium]
MSKYSDDFMDWIKEAGFTHCFFVAGGNAMHLIESASSRFICTPFINEIGAGIAAESFNEICVEEQRAFVLVTAGPGITNLTTAVASAWVDRRELLVVGGQAKSTNLARGLVRQVGFQEIGGVALLETITKASVLVDDQIGKDEIWSYIRQSKTEPKGPVFLEVCLDISMQQTRSELMVSTTKWQPVIPEISDIEKDLEFAVEEISKSKRPVFLIGGVVDRKTCSQDLSKIMALGIPIATTFNGADRCGFDYEFFAGRPGWYGSRWANLIVQQADLVIAIGSRLGLMETGYNWESFSPNAQIIQVDVERHELSKGQPKIDRPVEANPNQFLKGIAKKLEEGPSLEISDWRNLVSKIKDRLVKPESINYAGNGYVEYASFVQDVTSKLSFSDNVNPCSSGGNFESFGKLMINKSGQKWVTSPGLASMGFGLSGGIGMSLAYPDYRTLVFEGDGGLAQNLQEFGVAKSNNLNLKVFIADNGNYGSIKAHQKSAFDNHYIGCDKETGLWLPDWELIAHAFGISVMTISSNNYETEEFVKLFNSDAPAVFVVKVDPEQVIYPKIASARNTKGEVVSNPLHIMEPPLSDDLMNELCPHLK